MLLTCPLFPFLTVSKFNLISKYFICNDCSPFSCSFIKLLCKGARSFYRVNKTFISGLTDKLPNTPFITPSGTAFLRFSIKKREGFDKNATQLEKSNDSIDYIEHRVID